MQTNTLPSCYSPSFCAMWLSGGLCSCDKNFDLRNLETETARENGIDYDAPVKLTSARVYIQPGDSIRVPERYF
ncbi:hypothetical protein PsAD2_01968 [Pseudovibrio axinellae]|uniref:Polysaccharide biosynthesis/export protein n=1 Tax=Pseudovibrio axinellae TaxID=989403 RepID=A0A165Z1G1_9HYPH|nr:hypothetical protein [Pseudovibrio axinellae]KZL19429.1 hypothetical protein PsAD2_01968 [Pseudovibrio axinellae]SER59589.1 hypothetical protein SAMN05421798_11366 [Pseudovibrio axinellae]